MNIEDKIANIVNTSNYLEKVKLGEMIASKVKDNQVIGFGSGTTSFISVIEISKYIKEKNLNIIAIPTSKEIKELCDYLNINTSNSNKKKINWGFDGADYVDQNNNLIKGLGGAMFIEKIIIKSSPITYILVDQTKKYDKLDSKISIPIECYPNAYKHVINELKKIGMIDYNIREKNGNYILTDCNNIIIDAKFKIINKELESNIKLITGVIESGLFYNYSNIEVIWVYNN